MQNTKHVEENAPSKTSGKTVLWGILLFVGVMALTIWIIGRQVSLKEMIDAIKNVKIIYIILGVVMMVIFAIGEGLNIRRPLNMMGYKTTPLQGLKYAMVGFFFSSVTPSSTGGQPMQLYYMYHDDVRTTHGLLALLVQLMGWESANIGLAIIGYRTQTSQLTQALGNFRHLLLIGVVLHTLLFAFVVLLLFLKKTLFIVGNVINRLIRLFKLKKADAIAGKVNEFVEDYTDSAGALRGHPNIVWKTFLTSYVQFAAMYTVPILVYKSLGLSGFPYGHLFFMQAVLYAGVGLIPLPGAVGATESVFMVMFRFLIPTNMLAADMLLCRSCTLYLCLIIDAIGVAFFTRNILKKKLK